MARSHNDIALTEQAEKLYRPYYIKDALLEVLENYNVSFSALMLFPCEFLQRMESQKVASPSVPHTSREPTGQEQQMTTLQLQTYPRHHHFSGSNCSPKPPDELRASRIPNHRMITETAVYSFKAEGYADGDLGVNKRG
ncbi:hypothetical protein T265_01268 [Opisthorchis viverrini]|uniref:Uncharacterized protein n=1 Tax=Opisthorchis viverrini TaxID=6198 RepID=A0A075AJ54_OPIVI|nr:hypothetical protein T265_01268 [Opisthorchis viverrini]KER32789.1 hypothetical protein T265_01268 [Opisthorchis viverrini]